MKLIKESKYMYFICILISFFLLHICKTLTHWITQLVGRERKKRSNKEAPHGRKSVFLHIIETLRIQKSPIKKLHLEENENVVPRKLLLSESREGNALSPNYLYRLLSILHSLFNLTQFCTGSTKSCSFATFAGIW